MSVARLVIGYLRHNFMSALAYRGAFVLQAVGMLLNDVILLFFWWILFSRIPTLQGWNLGAIVTLYGIVAFGFGLANVLCGNAVNVARIIVTGELDHYLLYPADPLAHLLVSRSSLPAWGDLVFGVTVFFIATPWHWWTLPAFLAAGAAGATVLVSFSVLLGSLAFWLGSAENLASQGFNAMITFGLYPVEIFPSGVRVVLYTVIPAAFLGSVPASLVRDFSWSGLLGLLFVALACATVARVVFMRGLRRYESGNLVIIRG